MDITILAKNAKASVDKNSLNTFTHYFKEEYVNAHPEVKGNLDYILQEKDLIAALRNINQVELDEEINKSN